MPAEEAAVVNDGYVLDRNTVLLAAQPRSKAGTSFSRVAMIKGDKWHFMTLNDAALSVAGLPRERLGLYLGHNGDVLVVGRGAPFIEKIDEVQRYGTVHRIREIGGSIYACGTAGQVYARGDGAWHLLSQELVGSALDFEDIGGTSPSDLWVVGSPNEAFRFDGARWRKVDLPTNRPLGGVRAISSREVYICGDDGSLFVGDGSNWRFIGDGDVDHIFWSVESFQNKLYAAYDGGIMCFDGAQIHDLGLRAMLGQVDCHRLHANDGVLYSFGFDTVLCFDGAMWRRVSQRL